MMTTGKAWDVVGYTYQADIWCPDHIREMFGDMCNGIDPCTTHQLQTRDGAAFIANCYDPHSYDSSVYPKVIFQTDVEGPDRCGKCGEYLVGDASDYESNEEEE
jgi:hypothetical protein